MSDKLNDRRNFIKRASIAASVLAGSVVATAATSENKARGAGSNVDNGVVVGTSTKREILYKKTPQWNTFYDAAK